MSKLKEEPSKVSIEEAVNGQKSEEGTKEDNAGLPEAESKKPNSPVITEDDEDGGGGKRDILKLTMLINKYNSDLDGKRTGKNGEDAKVKRDLKCAVFFNKEVTIRPKADGSVTAIKESMPCETDKSKGMKETASVCEFSDRAVTSSLGNIQEKGAEPPSNESSCFGTNGGKGEQLKKTLNRRNVGSRFYRTGEQIDLRLHNSLTSLSKNLKMSLKGVLKSKIPSMTAIDANHQTPTHAFKCWQNYNEEKEGEEEENDDDDDDTNGAQLEDDAQDKHVNLQISKSNNDNNNNNNNSNTSNRRSAMRFKKEETGSVSDSKLLNTDFESKKYIKKCDKKSRGDSSKKENDVAGVRKQVQWKTEVDVIYFSTHLAANRDRAGEVIGRVMEPLREEWEQQRKGFYAKIVPYHIESHLKDHFISLLKI